MNMNVNAALFHGPKQAFEFQSFPMPEPRQGEILVRVSSCALCGSDLHTWSGRRTVETPMILGHEICGTIIEFGSDAPKSDLSGQSLQKGDRISWTLIASCHQCFYCQRYLPQKCERLFKYGHQSTNATNPLSGGLSEYCLLAPGTGIMRLSEDLPDSVACSANCATATIAAAFRLSQGCHNQTILIQGAGLLGLTACAMARELGASEIICCDVNETRVKRAEQFGATQVCLADKEALIEIVNSLTAGRGVDLILEVSGSAQAIDDGLSLLRLGGQYVWMGSVWPSSQLTLDPQQVVTRQLTILGSHNYIPIDLKTAITFLHKNFSKYPWLELVSEPYSLYQINEAFADAIDGKAVRVIITP